MDTLYRQVTQDYRYFGKHKVGEWITVNNLRQYSSKDPMFKGLYEFLLKYTTFCDFPFQKVLKQIQTVLGKSPFEDSAEINHFRVVATLCSLLCISSCLASATPFGIYADKQDSQDMSNVLFSGSKVVFSVGSIGGDYTTDPSVVPYIKKTIRKLKMLGFDISVKENSGYYMFTLNLKCFDKYKDAIEKHLQFDIDYENGKIDPFNFDDPLAGLEKAY